MILASSRHTPCGPVVEKFGPLLSRLLRRSSFCTTREKKEGIQVTYAGVLSTASDLVFSGGREEYFYALNGARESCFGAPRLAGK